MIEIGLPILIIFLLILINGFFVAAEFAIAGSSRPRITQMAESGSPAAQHVLRILNDPNAVNRYLGTAQIGITVASLGLGMYGEHAIADWLIGPLEHLGWFGTAAAHTVATIASVALLTYLHVVLGEMIPKSIALQAASESAVRLSGIMALIERGIRPLTRVLNWIGNRLLHFIGIPIASAETRLISSTELAYIVEESSEGGLLDPAEQIYLENVIDFHERTVGQVMTPRTRMAAIPVEANRNEVMALVVDDRHSRYPVYEGDRDHILGILHVKDLARTLLVPTQGSHSNFDLRSLLRPAVFVPESLALDEMLSQFRARHFQVALVLDEYGGTAGLVTLEDLAEEIIGEIQDEFDEELPPFAEVEPNTLRVRGDLLLDELTQHFNMEFEDEEAETVGGFIMSKLGHIAQAGDEIVYHTIRFVVESIEGMAVNTALVYLPPEHIAGEGEEAARLAMTSPAEAPADEVTLAPSTPLRDMPQSASTDLSTSHAEPADAATLSHRNGTSALSSGS